MRYKLDYTLISRILVFLKLYTTRVYVGKLEHTDNKWYFTYDAKYLDSKKAIPMGPELPLVKQHYESGKLFEPFKDRLPSKDNPAYGELLQRFQHSPR